MESNAISRISVLITAYRNAGLVRQCLESLLNVLGGRLPETVLVDDAAGDADTKTLACEYARHGVKFVVMPRNGGFAGANNKGYPLCTKDYVILVNSDIVFREDSLTPLVEFMDAHPRAGIAQGTLIIKNGEPGVDGKLNGCGAFFSNFGVNTNVGWLAPAEDPAAREARKCFAAYGAMFIIRRGVVESLGNVLFYDFFHTYYEEVNLCHRAWLAGWEVWYVPTPVVEHRHGATMGRFYTREDVLRKFYRNIRFSYLTCLGWRGLLTVYPRFEFLALGQAILPLLKFKGMYFRAHLWSWCRLLSMPRTVWRTRRFVQRTRKVGDRELFKVVMRTYPLKDFIAAAKGSL